jgi:hypothetical protein
MDIEDPSGLQMAKVKALITPVFLQVKSGSS